MTSQQAVLIVIVPGNVLVNRRMLRERAVALAVMSGRSSVQVKKCDWEQAKREATRLFAVPCRDSAGIILAPWTRSRSENYQ